METPNIKQILDKIPNLKSCWEFFNKLLSKQVLETIVLDLSSSENLKIFNLDLRNGIKVSAVKIIELGAGNKNDLIKASLQAFIKENNILHKDLILVPCLSSFLIKRLELPSVPIDEIAQAIGWKIKDEVGFDLLKSIIDCQIVKKVTKENGAEALDVICAVAIQDEISQEVLLLKQLELRCFVVSLPAFGYAKIIQKFTKSEDNSSIGVLHLEEENSYMAFYKNGKLDFYRGLPVTIKKLKDSLTDELATESGKIKLKPEEIEEALFIGGIPIEGSTYKGKIAANQILAMLRLELERLLQEIKRSLVYYNTQFQSQKVKRILISGKGLRIVNLDKFLSSELGLDVKMLSLDNRIQLSGNVDRMLVESNSAVLGLALDAENNLNLLPREFRSEKIEMAQKLSIRWVALTVFAFLMVYFFLAKVEVGLHQRRLKNAQVYLKVLSQVKISNEKLAKFDKFIKGVKTQDILAGEILKVFSNVTSEGIFFDSLAISADTKSGTISGNVVSKDNNPDTVLVKMVNGMNESGYFQEANIVSVEKSQEANSDISKFQITFKLL